MTAAATTRSAIDALLAPRSVAFVGASSDPEKLGSLSMANLIGHGFTGAVYPIHRSATELQGRRCYASFADLPEAPDLAFLVLPAAQCVEAAREAGARGARAAVIAASGFREAGTAEGERLQDELVRVSRETGMRLLGPNTNGFYNARLGISAGYNGAHAETHPPGPLTILAHSGALFSTFTGRAHELGLGLGAYVALGGEADLSMLDLMEWVIDDPECRVIGLVIEALHDAPRFRSLVARAQMSAKQVLALKLGRSALGHAATQAHSSRLAGSARSYAALFRQSGVLEAETPEGFIAAAALLCSARATEGSLGGITTTGAGAALLADAAARYGIPFAGLTAETRARLDQYRKFAPVLNPIDIGATGTEATPDVAGALAADPSVGAIVVYAHQLLRVASRENVARGIGAARATTGKPAVVLAPGGLSDGEVATYRSYGIPVLKDSAACFEALRAITQGGTPDELPAHVRRSLPRELDALLSLDRTLTEEESGRLLRAFGVPVIAGTLVHDEAGAVAAAAALGGPAVLKGIAPGVTHKSDLGLVVLGLRDEMEVRTAHRALRERAAVAGLKLSGILVQPQQSAELEAIVGLATEPGIGPVLVAGLGGIYAEALDEVATWVVPVAAARMREDLCRTPLGRILESPRRVQPGGLDDVVRVLVALQDLSLTLGPRVSAVDVNPLLLGAAGAVAVDALVIPSSSSR